MTTIVFFADENCSDRGDLGNVTGPPTGFCTEFGVSSFGSFRVETLERTCAGKCRRIRVLLPTDEIRTVTIYDRDVDYCSSSTLSVANFGQCMTNATVSWCKSPCNYPPCLECPIVSQSLQETYPTGSVRRQCGPESGVGSYKQRSPSDGWLRAVQAC